MNDEELVKPVCGTLVRRGDVNDEELVKPVCGALEPRGDMSDEELAKPVCGVLAELGLALTEADKGCGSWTPLDVCVLFKLSNGDINALDR